MRRDLLLGLVCGFVLAGCVSDEEYFRAMEERYREECTALGQASGTAYDECREGLIKERQEEWREKVRRLEEERQRRKQADIEDQRGR